MKIYISIITIIGFLFQCSGQVSSENKLIKLNRLKIGNIKPMSGEHNPPYSKIKQYTSMEEALANKESVIRLYLNPKRVSRGIPKSITELKNLEELVIRGGLVKIPDFITQLKNLRRLYLDNNSFSKIPINISELKKLEVLSIAENTIDQSPDFLGEIKSLKILNIADSGINKLPENIGNLNDLRILNISHTNIASLPESLKKLKKLEKLDIEGTKIKSILVSLADLPLSKLPEKGKEINGIDNNSNPLDIKILNLNNKDLVEVPLEIKSYKNLIELDLSNNQLLDIPEWIGELPNLEILDFTNNRIKKIPESIYKLKKLRYLYFSNNQLNFLPESIGKLKSLERLNLHENQIEKIPNSIGLLINLEYISFSGKIKLPKTFRNLKKLRNIGVKPQVILENSEEIRRLNLNEINLSESGLTEFPNWVLDMKSLVKLFLTKNKIETLPDLSSLSNLRVIDLCSNNLNSIPSSSVKNLKNLKLFVYNNNNIVGYEDYDKQDEINALYPDLYIIFHKHDKRRHR
ncbi:hypothetical protein D1818_19630 [Aquimarina sp. BL5]|uniref:leucine-rich repeat domain-containing protein n=2 Tax=Aquimarina sp. BL5 TaxID=1714860 RepID=UPI000E528957|nr:leucine-rich repeat domain-containing protein [Aquimarina sp. BL5]AXT52922.1 hypothetical protein D1818_19630 [Aquimarina sp. BL5]RKM93012.1 hypothetical protein D7036_22590 [Aquimarina sp. BL5]